MTTPCAHPLDWPEPGPISLDLHDPPHRSSATEWWYVNAHLRTEDGLEISVFAAFFRIARRKDEVTGEIEYAHSLTWALTVPQRKLYLAESWVDPRAHEIGLEQLDKGRGSTDGRVNRAMREVLLKGHVPLPDQRFAEPCFVNPRRLELDFGGHRFEKRDDGTYWLRCESAHHRCGVELTFRPEKEALRHGDDGVVRGARGEDMFYYFIPRSAVAGVVTLDAQGRGAGGVGWYDHEFGGHRSKGTHDGAPDRDEHDVAWNWVAIQLEDGREVSAYAMVAPRADEVLGERLVIVGADGSQEAATAISFRPTRMWRSTRTFFDYPVAWSLQTRDGRLDLVVEADVDDQELLTAISYPSFWEGRCRVRGAIDGAAVQGLAYVERSGFAPMKTLDDFFGAVGEEVRKSVEFHLPMDPTWEQTRDMIASRDRPHYMEGVSPDELARVMADPVRLITDRGGKSWRSYAALACCDVVGGDSRKWIRWLALPEFMHVGSLIVDDVQDRSEVRRGGPACHVVFGDALAINAGTACYFMGQKLLFGDGISDTTKLRLYDLYFEALRAGHAGQAIDLDPKTALVRRAVETGDARELEARILATHRLKTAAPAAALARMGAVVGGGTEAEIDAVGVFFEALGLAFQIIDDVLNIRGFKRDLKTRGEDIRNGTITLPVAVAMSRLNATDRRWLHETLRSKPSDDAIVDRAIELLEECGAVEDAAVGARRRVEDAWSRADAVLRDSFPKVMLRAFSWYVLERHY